jgi:hypothetical protein
MNGVLVTVGVSLGAGVSVAAAIAVYVAKATAVGIATVGIGVGARARGQREHSKQNQSRANEQFSIGRHLCPRTFKRHLTTKFVRAKIWLSKNRKVFHPAKSRRFMATCYGNQSVTSWVVFLLLGIR